MRIAIAALPTLAAITILTACATGTAGTIATPTTTPSGHAADELTTRAFVLDEGDGAQLCFSALESRPPLCSGPLINGWDWNATEGEETAAGSTWGDYEVFGTWSGNSLTLTRPPVLYDPRIPSTEAPGPVPPPGDPANAAVVAQAVEDYRAASLEADDPMWVVSSNEDQGLAHVSVIYDDGTLQAEADAKYGPGIVHVGSWLRPVADD